MPPTKNNMALLIRYQDGFMESRRGGADPEYHSMPMLRRLASLTTRTASCFLKGEAPLECPARIFREAFPKDAMQVPLGGVQDVRARHGVDIDDVLLHAQMMVSIKKGGVAQEGGLPKAH